MNYESKIRRSEQADHDRRIIRVDTVPDQAGIAASLRRAFEAGRREDTEEEFKDLLERIH